MMPLQVFAVATVFLLCAALAVAVWMLLRPPARSTAALRRRVDDLEADYATDHTELKRLVKRYRALEGHVYGSMEPEPDELAEPDGPNQPAAGSGTLELVPTPDFPEEEFRALLAQKRGLHGSA